MPCFAVAPQGASKTAVKNLINVAMFNCHINKRRGSTSPLLRQSLLVIVEKQVVEFSVILAFPLWGKVAPELAPVTDEGQQ